MIRLNVGLVLEGLGGAHNVDLLVSEVARVTIGISRRTVRGLVEKDIADKGNLHHLSYMRNLTNTNFNTFSIIELLPWMSTVH